MSISRPNAFDERSDRALGLPQRSEGWNFECPTGESESDCTSRAHREKADGNP